MAQTLIIISTFLLTTFVPTQEKLSRGKASYYADKFEGRPTASGEPYRAKELTAAHRKLPFGTMVRVTNVSNNKSVIVRVNDRGPHIKGRIIDVSRSAAEELDFVRDGIAVVTIEVLPDVKSE